MFAAGALAACSSPTERYGLTPLYQETTAFPNINTDPAKKQADPFMTPAQRAAAEAELKRAAGPKKP